MGIPAPTSKDNEGRAIDRGTFFPLPHGEHLTSPMIPRWEDPSFVKFTMVLEYFNNTCRSQEIKYLDGYSTVVVKYILEKLWISMMLGGAGDVNQFLHRIPEFHFHI